MTTEPGMNEPEVLEASDLTMVQALTKAEIDQQITTAKQYPRSVSRFQRQCAELVTLNEEIAKECVYALPRDGKTIEGPSSRLAEIVASAWGNCRAAARVIEEGREFVTAQGVFHDLETNTAISFEVKRRITNKYGKRYSSDMIATTGNAACSIALRNAVFKGVPKAYWNKAYEEAKRIIGGDPKTVEARRRIAIEHLAKLGVPLKNVLATLELEGEADIGIEELTRLHGILTATKEGETTLAEAFGLENSEAPKKSDKKGAEGLRETLGATDGGKGATDAPKDSKDAPAAAAPSRMCEFQGCTREAEAIRNGHWFCPEHEGAFL